MVARRASNPEFAACLLGDESQQPTWPQVRQRRRVGVTSTSSCWTSRPGQPARSFEAVSETVDCCGGLAPAPGSCSLPRGEDWGWCYVDQLMLDFAPSSTRAQF